MYDLCDKLVPTATFRVRSSFYLSTHQTAAANAWGACESSSVILCYADLAQYRVKWVKCPIQKSLFNQRNNQRSPHSSIAKKLNNIKLGGPWSFPSSWMKIVTLVRKVTQRYGTSHPLYQSMLLCFMLDISWKWHLHSTGQKQPDTTCGREEYSKQIGVW